VVVPDRHIVANQLAEARQRTQGVEVVVEYGDLHGAGPRKRTRPARSADRAGILGSISNAVRSASGRLEQFRAERRGTRLAIQELDDLLVDHLGVRERAHVVHAGKDLMSGAR